VFTIEHSTGTAVQVAALRGQVILYQWRSFKLPPSTPKCPGSGTEIIPGKHSETNTRIKPLPLINGHGRYITVTPERTIVSVDC
jgi:hypothetical protein